MSPKKNNCSHRYFHVSWTRSCYSIFDKIKEIKIKEETNGLYFEYRYISHSVLLAFFWTFLTTLLHPIYTITSFKELNVKFTV